MCSCRYWHVNFLLQLLMHQQIYPQYPDDCSVGFVVLLMNWSVKLCVFDISVLIDLITGDRHRHCIVHVHETR